jgi:hypothetical protein
MLSLLSALFPPFVFEAEEQQFSLQHFFFLQQRKDSGFMSLRLSTASMGPAVAPQDTAGLRTAPRAAVASGTAPRGTMYEAPSNRSNILMSDEIPPSSSSSPPQGLLVTVGEILSAHRMIVALQQKMEDSHRLAKYWEDECCTLRRAALHLEAELLLARAEATRYKMIADDHISVLYRARVAVGNAALLALRETQARAASQWREREKSLTDCLSSATSALDSKIGENKSLQAQVGNLKAELSAQVSEVLKMRSALEKTPPETAHFETEIAARDALIAHLQAANRDLSAAVCGGRLQQPSGAIESTPSALVSKMAPAALGDDSCGPRTAPPAGPTPRPLEGPVGRSGTLTVPAWRRKPVAQLTDAEMDAFLQHELQQGGDVLRSATEASWRRRPDTTLSSHRR